MVEGVAHGLVGVPYHLAVVVTKLSKAQRMMWDKTTTKTSALASSDRSGPLEALSPALPLARPEETMIFALGSRAVVHPQPSAWPLWLPACASHCQKSCSRQQPAGARSVISPLLRVALPQTKARPGRPQRASCAAAVRSHPQPSAWPLWLPAYASRCQKSCSRQQPAGGGVRVLVVSTLACCPAPRCSGALS